MNIFDFFFHWYSGAVWSNILASVLWSVLVGVPAFFWGRSKARKHLNRIHSRLDDHKASLDALHARIKEKL